MSAELQAKYLEAQIQTATPETLITMLYDGAIKFLRQAKGHLANGQIAEGNYSLQRAENIIVELSNSLDMSRGEIAENLRRLYDYMLQRIVEANVKKNTALIDEVLAMVTDLRATWVEAVKTVHTARRSSIEPAPGASAGFNRSV